MRSPTGGLTKRNAKIRERPSYYQPPRLRSPRPLPLPRPRPLPPPLPRGCGGCPEVAGDGGGAGSSIRAKTGGSFSFGPSSRGLPSVGLKSALVPSFFSLSFSFSFFGFDLTPALLKAASNCLDDALRTGRLLLGVVDDWPECDGPGAAVEVDVFPCAGDSEG